MKERAELTAVVFVLIVLGIALGILLHVLHL